MILVTIKSPSAVSQEQLKEEINKAHEKVIQAKQEVLKEEGRLKQDPSNKQIQKDLQQAKQALTM
ncbi:MAG: hypothetical protein OXJ52_09130 [Oligoflexia bacterium]|nr:hypothetical protein [Oligoflexia bacterium]